MAILKVNTMKSIYILLVLFCIISSDAFCQSWQLNWENHQGSRKMDFYSDVIEDENQNIIVFGTTSVPDKSLDFWLIKYNQDGDTLWTKTFGTKQNDISKTIALLANGDLLLLGITEIENSSKTFLLRTDNNGVEIWRKIFNEENYLLGEDIVTTEDSGFVMSGAKGENPENSRVWMAKANNDGHFVWEIILENDLKGSAKSLKMLPDGSYITAGQISENVNNNYDIVFFRISSTGELLWKNRIDTPNSKEWPECLCCSPDSCFMLVGWTGKCLGDINSEDPVFDFDLFLSKVDCKGEVIWKKNFDSEGSEGGNAVIIRPDGSFLVAGVKATSFLGRIGPWLLHINSEGESIDENLLQLGFINNQVAKMINCSDGGFIAIGPGIQKTSNYRSDGWIMKFSGF